MAGGSLRWAVAASGVAPRQAGRSFKSQGGEVSAGGRLGVRRVTGSMLGALLAVAAASAGMAGLSPAIASAATAEVATVSLNPPSPSRVVLGSESETLTGTVTGKSGDGYPKTGAVEVVATNGTTLCTGSLTVGSADAADFTCVVSSDPLAVGTYEVHAHYTGGTSSTSAYSYAAATSGTEPVTVATPTSKTATVSLSQITSPVAHGSEAQTFTGTVTGVSGDGYPKAGAVTVKSSTDVVLCTGSLTAGSGDAAHFTCDASTESKLAAGKYSVHAHYTGGTSSDAEYTYAVATSAAQTLTVVTGTKTPTVSLSQITSPVAHGSEAQTFTGTVTGVSGDGYPKAGAVSVKTSTDVVLCTGSLTAGSGDAAHFTCDASTESKLAAGKYSVHAHYTGGASSETGYTYAAATSSAQTLTVTGGVATSASLALNHTSRVDGAETSEVLTVTVTGKSGDGYPKGKVTIEATTGTTVCSTGTRSSGTSDSSKFTCRLQPATLAARAYELTATYTPPATGSSSTTAITYGASASAKEKLTVTARVTTTSALSLSSSSERSGAETSEVFSVKVTGKSGDGYPKGTVEVKTTGTALCTTSTATSHVDDSATYECSPRASALGMGIYTVVATYTPATSLSSSTASIGYAASKSGSKAFTVTAPSATRIYGATPDATAAEELESVYPGPEGHCPGTTSSRPVVLATDEHYPDALAASYLEKYLGTGMLLTPTSSITGATLTALRVEGITDVYVVGGPLAVSTSVVSQIQDTYSYECGGTTRTASHLTVFRIYGATQYTTAEDVAETPSRGFVGTIDLQGAYGLYNDTSGESSAAPPAGARRTAILASGAEFQDAEAAATLAYAKGLPLLLTVPTSLSPQALDAVTTLGVTQVILMGGPLAVSNAVVTALVDHGVSVIRVAGTDYTDTAVQLADMELGSTTGHEGLGWSATHGVTVARGDFFTDGLAGAVVAAHGGATGSGPEPVLLTETPTSVGTYLTSFLDEAGSRGIDDDGTRVTSLTILGGPLALTTAVVTSMEADLYS